MNKTNLIERSIKKLYIMGFFMLCFYQISSVLFGLSVDIVRNIITFLLFLSFVIFTYEFSRKKIIISFPRYLILYLLLIIILFICFIAFPIFFINKFDSYGRGSIDFITSYIIGIVTWMTLGSALYFSINEISSLKDNRHIFIISILSFFIFLFYNKGIEVIDYNVLSVNRGSTTNHLELGGFVIYLLIYSQSLSRRILVYLVFFLNIMVLFIIGGRSDILLYVIACFIFYTFFLENKVFKLLFIFVIILLVLSLFLIYLTGIADLEFLGRIISIFTGMDPSEKARSEILNNNIQDLPNKILIGNPNYFIDVSNNLGAYTHNILSVWEYFGFITFVLVCYILIFNMHYFINNKKYLSNNKRDRFAVLIFIFTFLGIVLSKSIFYYPFWFSLGYVFMLISFKKEYGQSTKELRNHI